MEELLMLL